jgi:transcriptional regulator NrdR family protein
MAECPVCQGEEAEFIASGGKESGVRRRSLYVVCPSCPTRYSISLELLNQLKGNAAEAPQLRARWGRLMADAARRGEKMTQLY